MPSAALVCWPAHRASTWSSSRAKAAGGANRTKIENETSLSIGLCERRRLAMKWLLIGLAVVVLLIALVVVIGLLLPKNHRASVSAHFKASAQQIWTAITDFEAMPSWRPGLKVERLPDRNGHPVWLEISRQGKMPLELVEMIPARKLVGRIADPNLPFGGTWTYEIAPTDAGATLTITEDGEIYNPVFRT